MNTNVYNDDILAPALLDMKEEHFRNEFPPVLPLTPPTKTKLSAETIFRGFGARNCGLFHRPITFQWTLVLGPY